MSVHYEEQTEGAEHGRSLDDDAATAGAPVEGSAGSRRRAMHNLVGKEENGKDHNGMELNYKEIRSVLVETSPQTTVEALSIARNAVLVRNQGDFVSSYDGDLFGLAFPDLFPYGRGHPGTERRVAVSLEQCLRYYLRLSGRQFAQHPTFALVSFDVCGRRRVANSTAISARHRSGQYESIATVSREELANALISQKKRREHAMAGRSSTSTTARDESKANMLLRNVRVSQSHMWASGGGERLTYRRKAFSMDAFLKSGTIFVTITPSDVGTITV